MWGCGVVGMGALVCPVSHTVGPSEPVQWLLTESPSDTAQGLACRWHPVDTCGIATQDEKKAAKMRALSSVLKNLVNP